MQVIRQRMSRYYRVLITSDHSIPIGEWIFHDWEDNNGSPSKNLQ